MTGRIPEEKIQEIRDRTDIVTVVSSYMPLKRSGANHLGLCPFHSEKSPSFNVNAVRQIFHCFGCGVGGNVFSFVMRMEGLSFPETVRRLGEQVGVEVEEQTLTPAELKRREDEEQLLRVSEVACDYYHQLLLENAEGLPGRRYLKSRGYDGGTARQFRIGYAPDRWEALAEYLSSKGFDLRWARDLGLIRPGRNGRDIDLFRKRLLFPILDAQGRVVAFGGRVLDEGQPKYLNSPESSLYHKGRILYGLHQGREGMRRSGEGIVVEGYFDLLALQRAGFDNVVATCGTALTLDHAKLLKRYAGRLLLLFDQDSAGRKATFRAMDVLLGEGLPASVVLLDPGEDPDSFLRKEGVEAFRKRLEAARPVLEVYMDQVMADQGDGIEGKARAAEEIVPKLRLLTNEIERDLYLKELAVRIGVEEGLLRRKVSGANPNHRPSTSSPVTGRPISGGGSIKPRRTEEDKEVKAQDWLLQMMILFPQTSEKVAGEDLAELFFDPDRRAIAEQMINLGGREGIGPELMHSDRLNETQKGILSGILIKDEKAFAEDMEKAFNDCRRAAERWRLKKRNRELQGLLQDPVTAGDPARLAEYQRELLEIKKRL